MARPSDQNGTRNRFPTLDEVLLRKTRPPVDLFCFYIFLQREGQEDILDFWLDVHQHENLCRAYFKDVRKSGRNIAQEWPQYWNRALQQGSSYDAAAGITPHARQSYLRSSDPFADPHEQHQQNSSTNGVHDNPAMAQESKEAHPAPIFCRERRDTETDVAGASVMRTVDGKRSPSIGGSFQGEKVGLVSPQAQGQAKRSSGGSIGGKWTNGLGWGQGPVLGGAKEKRKSRAPTVIPRNSAITKGELLLSAERIYARYLTQGGEKEIYLPPSLRIPRFPLPGHLSHVDSNSLDVDAEALASVPDMFVRQKAYTHAVLVQDAYPRFLRAKAFGNLTPFTCFFRLLLGLLITWGGLTAAFCFVFLDIQPRRLRLSLLVPFYISLHLLLSALYALDPLMVLLFNRSETTPFSYLSIQEPYVRKLLRKRSILLEGGILLLLLAGIMLWYWVPGHRL
ncbi:Regulator of G protein signalling superfamily [Phaffia rhodozyma]|uniref:Regulator of G protein signalling superfamily n=1 Tax=Phaffia rhodozyma TaxID=264483 RepID=A0A0F7SGX8_PHARH|nr:Regulator of G protein signalling superfamily [Phaffia rhodozyma]